MELSCRDRRPRRNSRRAQARCRAATAGPSGAVLNARTRPPVTPLPVLTKRNPPGAGTPAGLHTRLRHLCTADLWGSARAALLCPGRRESFRRDLTGAQAAPFDSPPPGRCSTRPVIAGARRAIHGQVMAPGQEVTHQDRVTPLTLDSPHWATSILASESRMICVLCATATGRWWYWRVDVTEFCGCGGGKRVPSGGSGGLARDQGCSGVGRGYPCPGGAGPCALKGAYHLP